MMNGSELANPNRRELNLLPGISSWLFAFHLQVTIHPLEKTFKPTKVQFWGRN